MTHAQPNKQPQGQPDWSPWPVFSDEMTQAVAQVLRSGKVNYWTGDQGRRFEQEHAEAIGCKHAIALANGTLSLELALRALGVGQGDEVIVPSRTFIASASSVVAVGARPVCADVNANTQTITAETIEACLTPRTKAIIPVHLAGWPCDMDPILDLAQRHSLAIIEDCAQAHGAEYKGRPVGTLGDAGAFSFCQDKIITTGGEGGMLVTNRTDLWDRAWRYKDHGKTPDAMYAPAPPGSTFRWLHEGFGSNYRLSEMQSAIGRIATRLLPEWTQARTNNAETLRGWCESCPALRVPWPDASAKHAWYKFYAFVRPDRLAPDWNRDRIVKAIRQRGVPCFSGSCSEVYLEQAFPADWRPAERHPVARRLGETSLMLLVHPTLTRGEIERTGRTVAEVMGTATASCAAPSAA